MAKKQPSLIDRSRVSSSAIATVVKGTVTPKSRAALISDLHNKLQGLLRTSVDTAMEIGRLLTEQKAEIAHGAWLPWVEENLPFDERTARRYMQVHEHRDAIGKSDTVSDLTSAYRYVKSLNRPETKGEAPPDINTVAESVYDRLVDSYEKIVRLWEHADAIDPGVRKRIAAVVKQIAAQMSG